MDKIKYKIGFESKTEMSDSSISCRMGWDQPKEAHHVEGEEWESGVVYPQPMNGSVYMAWTWPTTVRKVMNKS
jgi:hypothetical protein